MVARKSICISHMNIPVDSEVYVTLCLFYPGMLYK